MRLNAQTNDFPENPLWAGQKADFRLSDQLDSTKTNAKYDQCLEIMEELLEQGYKPIFSIPREYLIGKSALTPNKTWIADKILAGTLGITPYNPEGDRILCVYNGDASKISIKPRLTGPGQLFRGVVATLREIPLADCSLFDTKTNQNTSLIEINTNANNLIKLSPSSEIPESNTPEISEKITLKAELDEIFKHYEPQKLLEYLKKFLHSEYQTPLGTGFKDFTIADHTMRVLVQFEKYFKDEQLPHPITRDFLRLILALHDIGKKQSIAAGDNRLQSEFNKIEIKKMLEKFGFPSESILMAKTMVGFDPIGDVLKSKNPQETAKLRFIELEQYAREFRVPTDKFYELLKIYYMSDASAYTSDARFPAMLDELFEFDKPYQKIYLSAKTETKLAPLEDLIY